MGTGNELDEMIRVNLNVKQELHPEIHSHLSGVSVKARAEEIRYLMRLGLLAQQGKMGGVAAPLVAVQEVTPQIPSSTTSSASDKIASDTSTVVQEDPDVIQRDDSDLDFGDDLLGIGE